MQSAMNTVRGKLRALLQECGNYRVGGIDPVPPFLILILLPPVQVLLSAPNDAPFGQVHIWSPPGTGTQR